LVKQVRDQNIKSDALHSDLKQSARERVMRSFREGKIQILVATDIAARGIDVKGVDAVINYDVPKDMKYYVHRIGRTARAKMTGNAYTLIDNDIHHHLRTIERETKEKLIEHVVEGVDLNTPPPPRQNNFSSRFSDNSDRFSNHSDCRQNFNNRREHREHKPNVPSGPTTRFFINIGTKDKLDNRSLAQSVAKIMDIPSTDITDV
jgi:superfamily II DNA/RNA helicase